MRRALIVLTLVLAAAAVAAVRAAPARASCAAIVVWHDTAYFAYATSGPRPHPVPGARVRGAVEPACNDTGGGPGQATSVGARSIAGVPPQVALLSGGGIYVPVGEFPQLPGFPIRFVLVDDATRTCRLGPALTLTGRAVPGTGRIVLADVRSSRPVRLFDHRLIDLTIDVHTRITGLSRAGLPSIGAGQRVRIGARRCGGQVLARTIAAAGPIVPASTAEDILGSGWRGDGGVIHQLGGMNRVAAALAVLAVGVLLVLGLRAGRRGSAAGAG